MIQNFQPLGSQAIGMCVKTPSNLKRRDRPLCVLFDAATGALSNVSGSPFVVANADPTIGFRSLHIHQSGRFLYFYGQGFDQSGLACSMVWAFSICSNILLRNCQNPLKSATEKQLYVTVKLMVDGSFTPTHPASSARARVARGDRHCDPRSAMPLAAPSAHPHAESPRRDRSPHSAPARTSP